MSANPPPRHLPVLLALITAIGPFSIDAYLPSFPDIGASLGATPLEVQQTLPAYLLPFAAGNFIYIAAADLLPELTSATRTRDKLETSGAFVLGLAILLTATQLA